jgi:hypothetical protein
MSQTSEIPVTDSPFGDVIYSYTRAQAIEDGVLIDAGPAAKEAGFRWPVALTTGAWSDCVEWTDDDSRNQTHQDQSGRLWDVLWMATSATHLASKGSDQLNFKLYRIPRDGRSTRAEPTHLKLIVGPGDQGEPVVTILLPHED